MYAFGRPSQMFSAIARFTGVFVRRVCLLSDYFRLLPLRTASDFGFAAGGARSVPRRSASARTFSALPSGTAGVSYSNPALRTARSFSNFSSSRKWSRGPAPRFSVLMPKDISHAQPTIFFIMNDIFRNCLLSSVSPETPVSRSNASFFSSRRQGS